MVVKCDPTHRRYLNPELAALYISQRECRIRDLLHDHPNFSLAVVAELHRLFVYCPMDEAINEQGTQSSSLIIRYHDLVDTQNRVKDGGRA